MDLLQVKVDLLQVIWLDQDQMDQWDLRQKVIWDQDQMDQWDLRQKVIWDQDQTDQWDLRQKVIWDQIHYLVTLDLKVGLQQVTLVDLLQAIQ